MEYKIVCCQSRYLHNVQKEICDEISKLLNKGWKPQGGISITSESDDYDTIYTLVQAMVKPDL